MSEVTTNGKQIFWQNPTPPSPRNSRIIRLQIEKETKESIKLHYEAIEEQILNLQPSRVTFGDKSYTFKHHAVCTMMDCKTCNVLTKTALLQACNVCRATPKELNNLDLLLKKQYPTTAFFKFGIFRLVKRNSKMLPLPVGLFSEDVLETSQKEFKNIRLFYDSKTSRIDTNTDIVHWMLMAGSKLDDPSRSDRAQ
ncbi:unnamed protein product [Euphydryas editha]|uniref:Uncharacterized protein n=1 Tax=Euphydryas editha TaxID=104508 RepID=A0AAU9UTF9_EUPED|nr:unnamed protein product [Euphydryas editha]